MTWLRNFIIRRQAIARLRSKLAVKKLFDELVVNLWEEMVGIPEFINLQFLVWVMPLKWESLNLSKNFKRKNLRKKEVHENQIAQS